MILSVWTDSASAVTRITICHQETEDGRRSGTLSPNVGQSHKEKFKTPSKLEFFI